MIWLALFLLWFSRFELPNGTLDDGTRLSRPMIWASVADLLLESVFPTPQADAPPSGWRYLPQRFGLLGTAAFILAGAWGWGFLALRGLGLRDRFDRPSRVVFAVGLGLSGLSLLTLGCGSIGLLSRWLLGGVILCGIIAEVAARIRERPAKQDVSRVPWSQRRWRGLPIVCLATLTPFVLAMVLGAMLPSTDFDVKEYHLEGPKEYFLQGRVTFLSHNVYTSFPFLTEMLSLLGMVLTDDWYRGALVGKAVLTSFAPLTAVGLFAAGRRWFHPTVGWLCVLLYLTTPWVYRISIIAYAEGGLTFYLFATLLSLLWLLDNERSNERLRFSRPPLQNDPAKRQALAPSDLLLTGLLAGSAVACKYPGVLSVAIPIGGFLLLATWRNSHNVSDVVSRSKCLLKTAGWFTLGTLVTFGPWMAKNIVETGNPVYPLLYTVFGGADWDEASHHKWQNAHPPAILHLAANPKGLLSNLGTRIVDVVARSDWQSPLLFGAAPLAFLWRTRWRLVGSLWLYVGWLFLTWWSLTHQLDRFWVPMLPVVALLAGAGIGAVIGAAHEATREPEPLRARQLSLLLGGITTVVIAAAVLFNLVIVTTRLSGYNNYLIDLDFARHDPSRMTASIALLDNVLPTGSRVLMVGEAEVFDADFDYVYNTVFDESLFERWTAAAVPDVPADDQPLRSADDIRKTLHEQGITHLFVNWSEILRYRTTYGYTPFVSPERFAELVRAGVLAEVPLDPQRSLRLWESLDEPSQAIVHEWDDLLRRNVAGIEAFQQFELFEVR